MKKLIFGTLLLASMLSLPPPTMAEVNVNIGFWAPPVIRFHEPPRMVVLPDTYIYVAPDIDVDIFFTDGWWWRPYRGEWYRSRNYNSGWSHHRQPPSFYSQVNRSWRDDYRTHRWKGHQWNPERRDHREVQRYWNQWRKERHWERTNNWGVQRAEQNQDKDRHFQQDDRGKNDQSYRNDWNDRNDRNDWNDKHDKYDKHDNHGNSGRH